MKRCEIKEILKNQFSLFSEELQEIFTNYDRIEMFCIDADTYQFGIWGYRNNSSKLIQNFKDEDLFNQLISA